MICLLKVALACSCSMACYRVHARWRMMFGSSVDVDRHGRDETREEEAAGYLAIRGIACPSTRKARVRRPFALENGPYAPSDI